MKHKQSIFSLFNYITPVESTQSILQQMWYDAKLILYLTNKQVWCALFLWWRITNISVEICDAMRCKAKKRNKKNHANHVHIEDVHFVSEGMAIGYDGRSIFHIKIHDLQIIYRTDDRPTTIPTKYFVFTSPATYYRLTLLEAQQIQMQ